MRLDEQGFTAVCTGNRVHIAINRDFDVGRKDSLWTERIISAFRDPEYLAIVIDLGACPVVSSTVIAGLVHLHDHYWQRCREGVILQDASPHVLRVLEVMRLGHLFGRRDSRDTLPPPPPAPSTLIG